LRSWSTYENGTRTSGVDIVPNVAHILGVSISELFGEEILGKKPSDLSEFKSTGDIYLDIIGTQARAMKLWLTTLMMTKGK
jgi:hypothetical protein